MKYLKSTLWIAMLLIGSPVFALGVADLAGTYRLQGVMETAGVLILNPDQSYSASFIYGAADWTESGAWKIHDKELVLGEGHFTAKNHDQIQLILPSGTRFTYHDGKLSSTNPRRKLIFTGPAKAKGDSK